MESDGDAPTTESGPVEVISTEGGDESQREAEPPRRRGRRAAPRTRVQAFWDDEAVAEFLKLREKDLADNFKGVKNNNQLNESWIVLAGALSVKIRRAYDSDQCRRKYKALRKDWTGYATPRTGNEPQQEPPHYAIMQEYWSGAKGLSPDTLLSSDEMAPTVGSPVLASLVFPAPATFVSPTKRSAPAQLSPSSIARPSKTRKTQGEYYVEGMKEVADGLKAMGAAFAAPQVSLPPQPTTELHDRLDQQTKLFMAAIQQQTEAIQRQTQMMMKVLESIDRKTS